MKTKEQVLSFLSDRRFGHKTLARIRYFLLGKGLYMGNSLRRGFGGEDLLVDEFVAWFDLDSLSFSLRQCERALSDMPKSSTAIKLRCTFVGNHFTSHNTAFKVGDVVATVDSKLGIMQSNGVVFDFDNGHRGVYPFSKVANDKGIIFHAILRDANKSFNYKSGMVEDSLLVPDGIDIFRSRDKVLVIGFNDTSQFLYSNPFDGIYCVLSCKAWFERVKCKLVPCKREDLKVGDIAHFSNLEQFKGSISIIDKLYYGVVLNSKVVAVVVGEKDICVHRNTNDYSHWYKVTPIDNE